MNIDTNIFSIATYMYYLDENSIGCYKCEMPLGKKECIASSLVKT